MCKVFTNRRTFIPKEILIFQTFKQWMKIPWFLERNYNRGGRLLRILLIFSISDSSSYWNLQVNFDIQEFNHINLKDLRERKIVYITNSYTWNLYHIFTIFQKCQPILKSVKKVIKKFFSNFKNEFSERSPVQYFCWFSVFQTSSHTKTSKKAHIWVPFKLNLISDNFMFDIWKCGNVKIWKCYGAPLQCF